jgi:ubiquinone/menaquinone biosynthesis C-methylase UbiE
MSGRVGGTCGKPLWASCAQSSYGGSLPAKVAASAEPTASAAPIERSLVRRELVAPDTGEAQHDVLCPMCRSVEQQPVLEATDWLLGKPGRYRIVRCARCDLQFLNPRPAPEALSAHYPDTYICYTNMEDEHWFVHKNIQDLQRRMSAARLRHLERAAGRLGATSQVLDVGCGRGDLLAYIQHERGSAVIGVDFNETVARVVRKTYDIEVIAGTLPSAAFDDARFDVVIMAEYLEHEPDPQRVLCEALRVLKPGGHIAIEVPDISGPPARLFKTRWWQLDAPRHLIFFTPATLPRMLETTGFQIVRVKRFGRVASMGYSLLQALGLRYADSNHLVYLVLATLLGLPFAPFLFLLPDFMFVVAKKPLTVLPESSISS